jgi:hypothetical protein
MNNSGIRFLEGDNEERRDSMTWMDGWISFRPEALSLKGLGTLTTVHTIRPLLPRSRTIPLSCPLRKAS